MFPLVSFVLRGKVRHEILKRLATPKTPTMLSREMDTHQSTISRALKELQKRRLVECLTPDEKLSRLYVATPEGKKILHETEKIR